MSSRRAQKLEPGSGSEQVSLNPSPSPAPFVVGVDPSLARSIRLCGLTNRRLSSRIDWSHFFTGANVSERLRAFLRGYASSFTGIAPEVEPNARCRPSAVMTR